MFAEVLLHDLQRSRVETVLVKLLLDQLSNFQDSDVIICFMLLSLGRLQNFRKRLLLLETHFDFVLYVIDPNIIWDQLLDRRPRSSVLSLTVHKRRAELITGHRFVCSKLLLNEWISHHEHVFDHGLRHSRRTVVNCLELLTPLQLFVPVHMPNILVFRVQVMIKSSFSLHYGSILFFVEYFVYWVLFAIWHILLYWLCLLENICG